MSPQSANTLPPELNLLSSWSNASATCKSACLQQVYFLLLGVTGLPKKHECLEEANQAVLIGITNAMKCSLPSAIRFWSLCRGCSDICCFVPSLSASCCSVVIRLCSWLSLKKTWFLLVLNLNLHNNDHFLEQWEFSQPSHSTCLWLVRKQITCRNIKAGISLRLPFKSRSHNC